MQGRNLIKNVKISCFFYVGYPLWCFNYNIRERKSALKAIFISNDHLHCKIISIDVVVIKQIQSEEIAFDRVVNDR